METTNNILGTARTNIHIHFDSINGQANNKINRQYHHFETLLAIENLLSKARFDNPITFDSWSLIESLQYFHKHLYLTSFQFTPSYNGRNFNRSLQADFHRSMEAFLNSFQEEFINRPLDNNTKLQPFLQAHFEDENARHSFRDHPFDTPHYHGLMLLHPQTSEKFEATLKSNGRYNAERDAFTIMAKNHRPLHEVAFTKFDPAKGSFENMVLYATKGSGNDRFARGQSDLESSFYYPDPDSKSYPFNKFRKSMLEAIGATGKEISLV